MKNLLYLILPLLIVSCIEEPPFEEPAENSSSLTDFSFDSFNFETSQMVALNITDYTKGAAKYRIHYLSGGESLSIGSFIKQSSGLSIEQLLPASVSELYVTKISADGTETFSMPVSGASANLTIQQTAAGSVANSSSDCIDHLYAVNNNGDFFTIDISNSSFTPTDLSQLQGGGSIANALDQANGIMYYNVGKTLYAYDIASSTFSVKHTNNPFNGNYPRLEYKDGYFYMSNKNIMHKVEAATNNLVASYTINGFINNSGGGDLAFDSNGELYLACFSGLYKFTSINDTNGTAEIVRISAENFPFQLTSMAIDRQDRIFVGTNDANSNLIQISKEDGAYQIVKTFNKKINDLTAWKCDTGSLNQQDSDNDGVIDELDDYPNDPTAAVDSYTPSELGMGTFAFEDLWPVKGDYDFNDMVIGYRYTNVLNSDNKSVRFKMSFTIRAVGAANHSGFGIELDVDPTLIASVSGHKTDGQNTTLNAKGLEAQQNKSVIIVFNDSFNHLKPAAGAKFINTDPSESSVAPFTVEVVVEFTNPIAPELLGEAPFNPFIFSSYERGKELHLAGKMPTSLADASLFGTASDDTNVNTGKTYQDSNNLPWAIHIIHEFRYPIEKNRIDQGYNKFVDWGLSSGALYKDWYGDNSGYRNTNKIYFNN
jgi:LruC domain-containing protein